MIKMVMMVMTMMLGYKDGNDDDDGGDNDVGW